MAIWAPVPKRACAAVIVVAVGSALSVPASADRNEATEISFDEALALGEESPSVDVTKRALEARERGDEKIRGAAGATHLTFMPGALVEPREISGFDMQATVTQGWNLGGLGEGRREAASLERGTLSASVRARALRARLEAARRWIDLDVIEEVAQIVEARIGSAETLVEGRERALVTEVGTVQHVEAAKATLAQLRQRRLTLEGNQFAAATQLALAIGRAPTEDRLVAVGDRPDPILPDVEEIRSAVMNVDAAPDVVVAKVRETAARARAVEASAEYGPTLITGAQAERPAGDLRAWVESIVAKVMNPARTGIRTLSSLSAGHAELARQSRAAPAIPISMAPGGRSTKPPAPNGEVP